MQISIRQNVSECVSAFGVTLNRSRDAIRRGVRGARPKTDAVLKEETRAVFNVRDPRADRMWRVFVASDKPTTLSMRNLMRGFEMHVMGGTIGPRGGEAVLIPINTRGGTRIGRRKFYNLINTLRRLKLTFVKNGILWVRIPTNRSKRGGVAVGSRVQKSFRSLIQGSKKRPSGFELPLNAAGSYSIAPIAVVKHSISMRPRFDMLRVAERRVIPILLDSIRSEMRTIRLAA